MYAVFSTFISDYDSISYWIIGIWLKDQLVSFSALTLLVWSYDL